MPSFIMVRHRIDWKKVYLEIVRKLLYRGGKGVEGAVGHQTVPIGTLTGKIHDFYRGTVKEGIKRLVYKHDLKLWPKGVKSIEGKYSVSLNPKHLSKLEHYLHGHSKELQRLRNLKKQFHYKGKEYAREYVWLLLGISGLVLALAFLGSITGYAVLSRKVGLYYVLPICIILIILTAAVIFLRRRFSRNTK